MYIKKNVITFATPTAPWFINLEAIENLDSS